MKNTFLAMSEPAVSVVTSFGDATASVESGPVALIRSEYREMPGLSLSEEQVLRFWHLDASVAHRALERLVESGFLRLTANGTYVRADCHGG